MMEKDYMLYIFDADGTLVRTRSGDTFRRSADDWEFLPGRVEYCRKLQEAGAVLAIASNQNGVAFEWSKYSEEQIKAELVMTGEAIGASHVSICFNGPNPKCLARYYHENDPRRKPNPGMILEIKEAVGCELQDILFVGDRDEDQLAAKNAGVAFIWCDEFFPPAGLEEEDIF